MKITTEGQAASVSDSFPLFYLPFESKGTLFYLRLYLFSLLETSSLHLMEVKVSHRQPPFLTRCSLHLLFKLCLL